MSFAFTGKVEVVTNTCYNVEDLENLVFHVLDRVNPVRWSEHGRPDRVMVTINYAAKGQCDWGTASPTVDSSWRRRNRGNYWYSSNGGSSAPPYQARMYIPRKTELVANGNVEALVWSSTDGEHLPNDLVAGIAEYLVSTWCLDRGTVKPGAKDRWSVEWNKAAVALDRDELPKVRIGKHKSGPKYTKEQRIARYISEYGPTTVMEGSRRTSRYLWGSRMYQASSYYAREFKRREEWLDKAIKLGADVSQIERHETFSEYLRRIATEIENNPKHWSY